MISYKHTWATLKSPTYALYNDYLFLYHHGLVAIEDMQPQFFHNVSYRKLGAYRVAGLVDWWREGGDTEGTGKHTHDTATYAGLGWQAATEHPVARTLIEAYRSHE